MPYYNGDQLVSPLLSDPPVLVNTTVPGATDNQYVLGQQWLNTSTNTLYYLTSAPAGVANWEILGSPTGAVATLTGDSGGAISPAAGNINVVTGANLTSVGSGSSITVSLDSAVDTTSVAVGTAALGLTLSTASIVADGTDAAIPITITPKGTGDLLLTAGDLLASAGDVIAVRSQAGGDVTLEATNSDNSNNASDAYVEVAVGGTSAGDAGIRFQVSGGQNYCMGLDNSDGDNLVIAGSNDLGTDNLMTIADAGDVTVVKGNLILGAVATQLQMNGGAVTDFIGQATLSSGTVTVLNTNIAAGDRVFVTRSDLNGSTAVGLFDVSITASTSFVIDARKPADATVETGDASIVDYIIVRQN